MKPFFKNNENMNMSNKEEEILKTGKTFGYVSRFFLTKTKPFPTFPLSLMKKQNKGN